MKAIVTTTINKPTKAIKEFVKIAKRDNWEFYVVGDRKTPHEDYIKLDLKYIHPSEQEDKYPKLSEAIGWNCIQRRNIGFIEAWRDGAEVIATIDDDNIPLENWGKWDVGDLIYYETDCRVFDPLSVFGTNLWHRGFPIQLLEERSWVEKEARRVKFLVQANLWNGEPDVDAIARIYRRRMDMEFDGGYFYSNKISPFNSQNTILSREVFPTYFLFPHIGRMDDIWASYITQFYFPKCVVYGSATVYQDRNKHDLFKDLEAEMFGYENTIKLVKNLRNWRKLLPKKSLKAYELYKKEFK